MSIAALTHRSDAVVKDLNALLLMEELSDAARDDALRLRATLQRDQQQREEAVILAKRNAERQAPQAATA